MKRLHAKASFYVRYLGFFFCALFFLGDNRVYERDGNEMSRCLVFGNDINTCSVFSEDEKTKWKNLFGF